MGKIFNILLNSDAGIGTAVNSKTYYFDWNRLPEGKYKVEFAFQSGVSTITSNFQPSLYINFGSGSNNFVISSVNSNYNPNFIGIIHSIASSNLYFATRTTNYPIDLDCRPSNNTFIVQLLNNANPPTIYTTAPPSKYSLTLSFILQD